MKIVPVSYNLCRKQLFNSDVAAFQRKDYAQRDLEKLKLSDDLYHFGCF